MEIQTVSSKMYALLFLYDMHSEFFSKVIDGITNEDAHKRLNTKANHVAWLTGSLVQERYELAGEMGYGMQAGTNELFKDHKGLQEEIAYPSLSEFNQDWEKITPVLRDLFMNVTDERLSQPFVMPGAEMPFYDLVAFTIYREANCIGQIALWRRLLGYEAMKYM
ncbi:MAG: DinB family protein [Sphingobacteriaceae bacterium]